MKPVLASVLLLVACLECRGAGAALLEWGQTVAINDNTTAIEYAPAIGRVMKLSRVGEPNMLWTNASSNDSPLGGWTNYGGDKLWPWPEKPGWGWPPPQKIDAGPYTQTERSAKARAEHPLGFCITGPVDPGSGLAGTRETWIQDGIVHSTYTLDRRAKPLANTAAASVAGWSITQVPAAATPYARLRNVSANSVTPLSDAPPKTRAVNPRWIEVLPNTESGKIGIDGDALAVRMDDRVLLIERTQGNDDPNLERQVGAQVYFHREAPADRRVGSEYTELELIGPGKRLEVGDSVSLQTEWRILTAKQFEKLLAESDLMPTDKK